MKYCAYCKKGFDTKEEGCPVCGKKLFDRTGNEDTGEPDASEIIAAMTALGLF